MPTDAYRAIVRLLRWAVNFLDAHNGTVTALGTLAIAVATALYVKYSKRLWKEARGAADLSSEHLKILIEQLQLTRQELELRMRPYLYPQVRLDWIEGVERLQLFVSLENFGSAAALMNTLQVTCTVNDDQVHQWEQGDNPNAIIFPGKMELVATRFVGDPLGHQVRSGSGQLKLEIRARYFGTWSRELYRTDVEMVYDPATKRLVNETVSIELIESTGRRSP